MQKKALVQKVTKSKIYADEFFAIIPEWVLYAPISSNAIRLYGVLRRFADSQNTCYPTRKTIAEKCQFSPATVDRAVEELKAINALKVTQRKSKQGDWTSNLYQIVTVDPKRFTARDDTFTADDGTGMVTDAEQTKASMNESQRTKKTPSPNGAVAQRICQDWWSRQDRLVGRFEAVYMIVLRILDAGWEPEKVTSALDQFVTIPTSAALQQRMKGKGNFQTKYDRNREALDRSLQQQKSEAIRLAFDALEKGNENG
jgi:Helix-turn-helix domain